ncbi:MAG: cadherin repeat domain-containing protein, partial [Comamonadaceae bacterium]
TLAYYKAIEAADGAPLTAADVEQFNDAIAALFGLPSLHDLDVVPFNGGDFDGSDGYSAGEIYGALLAAFSGADLDNGGDTQATIDAILAGLTIEGGVATLSEAAQALLLEGAKTAGATLEGGTSVLIDTYAPEFDDASVALTIAENSGAGQVVHTAAATDPSAVTYSLKAGGDAARFTIDPATGAVTLVGNPDHEAQASYTFTVIATDAAGNASQQTVTLAVGDLDETAPVITSGATAASIDENSGAGQVVYTVTATDTADVSGGVSYSLKAGGDAALFTIDAATGAVTLVGNPDFEGRPGYSFTVVATDAAGHSSEQAVTLGVNNLDEVAPTITSGATAAAIDENSGAGQVVYTVTATDTADISGGVSYGLKAGGDAALFTIDAATGAVTLVGNPDFETRPAYSFTVVATDAAGHSTEQTVTLGVNDRDEIAPVITSGATAATIDENSGAGQLVYTATATDAGTVRYSLAGAAVLVDGGGSG